MAGSNKEHALLERGDELAQLNQAVERACVRKLGVALAIEGPAGIGKTSLLAELGDRAAAKGAILLTGRGSELEREFPFGVAAQLFDELDPTEPGHLAGEHGFATLHRLYLAVVELATSRPVVLAIDDLHWADAPSIRLLAYIARRVEGSPLLLAVALRPHEPGAETYLIDALTSDPGVLRIAPSALSEAAATELVRAELDDAEPGFLTACFRASGGNPLLLRELARGLAAAGVAPTEGNSDEVMAMGPRAVSRAVSARLARLPEDVTRLARAAAILGTGARLRDAGRLVGLPDARADEAAITLVKVGLLGPGTEIEFAHPIVRAAIYEEIPLSARERAHAEAARFLAETNAEPAQVAAHLLAAPPSDDAWVVEVLRGAARHALAQGSAEAAVAYLRRALGEPPPPGARVDVLAELGAAETLTDGPAAVRHLGQALELIDDPGRRAQTTELLARVTLFAGRPLEGVEVARRGLAELAEDDLDTRLRLEAAMLNIALMEPALRDLTEELTGRAQELPEQGVGARMLAALVAYANARSGSREAVERAAWALGDGSLLKHDNGGGSFILAALTLALADRPEALEAHEAGLGAALRQGSVFAFAANKIFRGHALFLRGDLGAAASDLEEGLEASEDYRIGIGPPYATAYLAEVLAEQGLLDAAESMLQRTGEAEPENAHFHWWLAARVRVQLARGDARKALAGALALGEKAQSVDARNPAFVPWRTAAARCLADLGEEPGRARELAAEEVALARGWGVPRALGRALRIAGTVCSDQGLLREAVDVLRTSPAKLELAKALAELGAAQGRSGDRDESRKLLRESLELAQRCGAMPLEGRALTALAAVGAKPRRAALAGAAALTRTERRVAKLASSGLTNREIATELVVTQKTVEMHLTNAYRKLGVRSRTQLLAAVGQER